MRICANEEMSMSEEVVEPRIPLQVFCERLSESDKRVELVSAFFSRASRREELLHGTEAEFVAAYQDFCNQPA